VAAASILPWSLSQLRFDRKIDTATPCDIDDVRRDGVPGGELQSRHEDFSDLTHATLASKYNVTPRVEAACGSAAGREWAAADGTGAPLHELAQCAIDVPASLSRQPGRSQIGDAILRFARDCGIGFHVTLLRCSWKKPSPATRQPVAGLKLSGFDCKRLPLEF
jgi:hypothetical protein